MKQEIEARAHLKDDKKVLKNLNDLGFNKIKSFVQHDIMFDLPDGSLFKSGQKIRIRDEDGNCELTYKGKFNDSNQLSVRSELNIPIPNKNLDDFKLFLSSLGFPPLFEIKKNRIIYSKDDLTVTLDEWPIIGILLEIEGTVEDINKYKYLIAPGVIYKNFRLKELFEEVVFQTGKSLEQLVSEYEAASDYKIGNISAIF